MQSKPHIKITHSICFSFAHGENISLHLHPQIFLDGGSLTVGHGRYFELLSPLPTIPILFGYRNRYFVFYAASVC